MTFPGDESLSKWQSVGAGTKNGGQDKHSIVADPKFKDPASNNFDLESDSPALTLGFVPIDLSTVGPRAAV